MKRMPEEERDARLDRVPSTSVLPFVNLDDVKEWVEEAREVSAEVQKCLSIGEKERVQYAERSMRYIARLAEKNPTKFCSVPVDLMLWLHFATLSPEERKDVCLAIHTSYKAYIASDAMATKSIKLDDLPIEAPAREALRHGKLSLGAGSIYGALEMFKGLCISLYAADVETDVVLDELLTKILPGAKNGLNITIRDMSRYDIYGKRQYLADQQAYRLYKKKGDVGGTMLLCATSLQAASIMIYEIFDRAKKIRRMKQFLGDPKIVFYKVAAVVGSTVSTGVIRSKRKGLVYSREMIW